MAKNKKVKSNIIEQKPDFESLCNLRMKLNESLEMLNALANEEDTIQRASDLWYTIDEIRQDAKFILFEQE